MQIHQLLAHVRAGEPVTEEAFVLQELLSEVAESKIYAQRIDPGLGDSVVSLDAFASRHTPDPGLDIAIVHLGEGEPALADVLLRRGERVIVVDHGAPPPWPYAPYDPERAGRLLSAPIDRFRFSERATKTLEHHVCNPARFDGIVGHVPTQRHFTEALGGPVLLFVGEVAPHKRIELLIEAFYLLNTSIIPETHLAIVGPHTEPRYARALERQINELNLDHAWLAGYISDESLSVYLRSSSAFVSASIWEQDAASIHEAMAAGLPTVVAGSHEVLRGVGLQLAHDSGPALIAEAMAEVVSNESLAADMRQKSIAAVKDCEIDVARSKLLSEILAVANR